MVGSNANNGTTAFVGNPADVAKLVGALCVFVSVLIFTLLPAMIVRRLQRRQRRPRPKDGIQEDGVELTSGSPGEASDVAKAKRAKRRRTIYLRVVSCFNCFAAGVFVSTGLMDVLPDSIEDIEEGLKAKGWGDVEFPLAPFFMLVGFFIMLIIEQAVMCCSDQHGHEKDEHGGHASPKAAKKAANGTGDGAAIALKSREGGDDDEDEEQHLRPADRIMSSSLEGVRFPSHALESDHRHSDEQLEVAVRPGSRAASSDDLGHNHVSEVMMKSGSPVRTIFLVGAMSVHALFEGLALGLRRSSAQIYQLLLAICMHKSLIAMGIGLSLGQTRAVRRWLIAVCSLIFAGMSPLGTLIGMCLTYASRVGGSGGANVQKNFSLISGSLQGMACGTFLYVTFFEVLPREINEATRPRQRAMYLASLIAGFVAMCLFIAWGR